MEKEQVLKLYKEFLQKNPQIAYIKNVKRRYCSYKWEITAMEKKGKYKPYREYLQKNPLIAYIRTICREYDELIDSAYLRNNEVLKGENLPSYLTSEKLQKLNEKYSHKLKWDIIESDMTEEQIAMFEQENGVILPKQFREYIQGYSFLQGNFYTKLAFVSDDYRYQGNHFYYNRKTDEFHYYTKEEIQQNKELIGSAEIEFFGVNNPNDTLLLRYYENIKMLHLGNLLNGWIEMLLLDCETGEVQSWDLEDPYFEAKSKEEFEGRTEMGEFWFKDFDTFLEWVFGKKVYNLEEAKKERKERNP